MISFFHVKQRSSTVSCRCCLWKMVCKVYLKDCQGKKKTKLIFPLSIKRYGVRAESRDCHLVAGQTCEAAVLPEGLGRRGRGASWRAVAERRRPPSVRGHQPVPAPHRQQHLDGRQHAQVGSGWLCLWRVFVMKVRLLWGSHTWPKNVSHASTAIVFITCSPTLSVHLT